jgi:hypothetical protein
MNPESKEAQRHGSGAAARLPRLLRDDLTLLPSRLVPPAAEPLSPGAVVGQQAFAANLTGVSQSLLMLHIFLVQCDDYGFRVYH